MTRWLARSTVFAAAILAVGSVALFKGLLSGGEFVTLATVVHTFIVGRAVVEDFKPGAKG